MSKTYVSDGRGNILFVEPDARPFDVQKTEALDFLANVRWQASTRVNWRGYSVPITAESKSDVLGGLIDFMLKEGVGERDWKVSATEHLAVGYADLVDLGNTMASHVQACFDREKELIAIVIATKGPEELSNIAFDGWPGQ